MENVTIIGAGSWGFGLAQVLADNNHNITMYDIDKETIDELNKFHTNKNKLHEGVLSDKVVGTTNLEEAVNKSDIIFLVVPTAVIRTVLKQINQMLKSPKLFVNASKGIEPNTYKRVSQIVYDEIDQEKITGFVALTGPSHAEEVILRQLTVVAAASSDINCAKRIQQLCSNKTYFRVYTVTDLAGAELGGSLKNIYALATGICAGLGFGANSCAAIITRGLIEMKKIAIALGAKEETLNGLTGIGDLIVTCTSKLSRNYQAGYIIGVGANLDDALSQITMVVEGARTCVPAYQAAKKYNIYAPIIDAVYEVIYNHVNPREQLSKLMAIELKME